MTVNAKEQVWIFHDGTVEVVKPAEHEPGLCNRDDGAGYPLCALCAYKFAVSILLEQQRFEVVKRGRSPERIGHAHP